RADLMSASTCALTHWSGCVAGLALLGRGPDKVFCRLRGGTAAREWAAGRCGKAEPFSTAGGRAAREVEAPERASKAAGEVQTPEASWKPALQRKGREREAGVNAGPDRALRGVDTRSELGRCRVGAQTVFPATVRQQRIQPGRNAMRIPSFTTTDPPSLA